MKIRLMVIGVCAVLFLGGCSLPRVSLFDSSARPLEEFTIEGEGKEKILLLSVSGMISSAPKRGMLSSRPSLVEEIVMQLNKARTDPNIKAVLLRVNSSGGTITASDILYQEIAAYKAQTGNPVFVIMMDVAASGAYYLSLPADKIMAHPTSITGSVGVILLRPKVGNLMEKVGLDVEITKHGSHKDMGSPYRPSTDDEKALIQHTVDAFGKRFLDLVVKHRPLNDESLAIISTGRIFTADEALALNLIDSVGYIRDAVSQTAALANLGKKPRVVTYRHRGTPEENLYRASSVSASEPDLSLVRIELPDIINLSAGYYYLWPGSIGLD